METNMENPKVNTTTREDILVQAKKCVCGDREEDYGSPENNFMTIAKLWTDYLHAEFKDFGFILGPGDVAAMMILLKVSRIASGNGKNDNWVDIAGYAACGGELCGKVEYECRNL